MMGGLLGYSTVSAQCNAQFSGLPSYICPGDTTVLTAIVSGAGYGHNWVINNGTILSGQGTPSVTVQWGPSTGQGTATHGLFNNSIGCLISVSQSLGVTNPPFTATNMSLGPDLECKGDSILTYIFSRPVGCMSIAGSIFNGAWVVGDAQLIGINTINMGPCNDIDTIKVKPTGNGGFTLALSHTLFGNGFIGCTDTTYYNITPTNFGTTAALNLQTNGFQVTFSDSSIATDSVLLQFGDGNSSTNGNVIHTYTPGNYTVCLIAYGGPPCGNDTACIPINITCNPPQSAFSFTDSNLTIQLSNASNYYGNPVWQWDFGDGNQSSQENPNHTYAAPGIYTTCLIVQDSCGADTSCQLLQVPCQPPVASFSGNTVNLTANFFNGTTTPGSTFQWDFGDGSSSTDTNPIHTYATNGTYNVCLIATNSCGTDTTCIPITVTQGNNSSFRLGAMTGASLELIDVIYSTTGAPIVLGNYRVNGQDPAICQLRLDSAGNFLMADYTQGPSPSVVEAEMRGRLFNHTDEVSITAYSPENTVWTSVLDTGSSFIIYKPSVDSNTLRMEAALLYSEQTAYYAHQSSGNHFFGMSAGIFFKWERGIDPMNGAFQGRDVVFAADSNLYFLADYPDTMGQLRSHLIEIELDHILDLLGTQAYTIQGGLADQVFPCLNGGYMGQIYHPDGFTLFRVDSSHTALWSNRYTVDGPPGKILDMFDSGNSYRIAYARTDTAWMELIEIDLNGVVNWWDRYEAPPTADLNTAEGDFSLTGRPIFGYSDTELYLFMGDSTGHLTCPTIGATYSQQPDSISITNGNFSWSPIFAAKGPELSPMTGFGTNTSYICGPGACFSQPEAGFTTQFDTLATHFTNTSVGGGSFYWDFGDGDTSSAISPSHVYSSSGPFTVCLIHDDGCNQDTICQTISPSFCPSPTPAFTDSTDLLLAYFTNLSSSTGNASWLWDFGDGNTSTQTIPFTNTARKALTRFA